MKGTGPRVSTGAQAVRGRVVRQYEETWKSFRFQPILNEFEGGFDAVMNEGHVAVWSWRPRKHDPVVSRHLTNGTRSIRVNPGLDAPSHLSSSLGKVGSIHAFDSTQKACVIGEQELRRLRIRIAYT